MTEPTRMSPAEFAARRQLLGLTLVEMGERLGGVRRDTISHWESGRDPIPYRVPDELAELLAEHDQLVQRLVESDGPVVIERGDGWSLGAAARALEERPELVIEWE